MGCESAYFSATAVPSDLQSGAVVYGGLVFLLLLAAKVKLRPSEAIKEAHVRALGVVVNFRPIFVLVADACSTP